MTRDMQKSFYLKLGKRLTILRQRRNITIAQLSKLVGEQYKTIQSIESGNVCSLHHLLWMKNILGIEVSEIINCMEGDNGKGEDVVSGIDDII